MQFLTVCIPHSKQMHERREMDDMLSRRLLNCSVERDSCRLFFVFDLSDSQWRKKKVFTPLPLTYVLTANRRRTFLWNIFRNITFVLRDILCQVKVGSLLHMIQYKGCCGIGGNYMAVQMLKSANQEKPLPTVVRKLQRLINSLICGILAWKSDRKMWMHSTFTS